MSWCFWGGGNQTPSDQTESQNSSRLQHLHAPWPLQSAGCLEEFGFQSGQCCPADCSSPPRPSVTGEDWKATQTHDHGWKMKSRPQIPAGSAVSPAGSPAAEEKQGPGAQGLGSAVLGRESQGQRCRDTPHRPDRGGQIVTKRRLCLVKRSNKLENKCLTLSPEQSHKTQAEIRQEDHRRQTGNRTANDTRGKRSARCRVGGRRVWRPAGEAVRIRSPACREPRPGLSGTVSAPHRLCLGGGGLTPGVGKG